MRDRIVAIAIALTAVYAVVVGVFTVLLWPEPGEAFTLAHLGDYLAGVFSPLAFGWFVVTVFIQLEELRLQREELQESRLATQDIAREAGEQRRVLELQNQAAEKRLEIEDDHRREFLAESHLSALFLNITDHACFLDRRLRGGTKVEAEDEIYRLIHDGTLYPASKRLLNVLSAIIRKLERAVQFDKPEKAAERLDKLAVALQELEAFDEDPRPAYERISRITNLDRIRSSLRILIDKAADGTGGGPQKRGAT